MLRFHEDTETALGNELRASLDCEEGLVLSRWSAGEGPSGRRGRASWCQTPSLLFLVPQMELKAGKGAGERAGPDWKAALQREREEQQHLLAESYGAVMELTRQLQISERNWSQEKLQLVERLQGEKQQVEQQVKELQNRLSQVRPVPARAGSRHSGD